MGKRLDVYRDVLGRNDPVPGLIAGIQTFGELVHFHSHIRAIATDGGFLPHSTFLCLPRIDTGRLLAAWQTKVFEFLLAAEHRFYGKARKNPQSWRSIGKSEQIRGQGRKSQNRARNPK